MKRAHADHADEVSFNKRAAKSGKPDSFLFTYQLAQDLMLDEVIRPLSKLRLDVKVTRNLPAHLWDGFVAKPTFSLFSFLASLGEDVDVVETLLTACPTFLGDLFKMLPSEEHLMLFITFVIRMLDTLFFGKQLQLYWRDDIGFGLKTTTHLTKGVFLSCCWATRVELSSQEMQELKASNSGTCTLSVMEERCETQRNFALFGPLCFLQRACKRCHNVSHMSAQDIFSGPVTVTDGLFTACVVTQDRVRPGQELSFFYPLGACTASAHTDVCVPAPSRYSVPQRKINN